MDLEQKRIELENEIADVQSEIEIKVAELDEVRELLSKESFEEAHEDELDDEDFVADEGDDDEDLDDNETEDEDEDETEEDEDFEDEDEDEEDEDEVGTEEELKARESVLMEEVLVLQMKLTALNKQLNDILAQQGMDSLRESEE